MEFSDMRIKDVNAVVRFRPAKKHWTTEKRNEHYVGVHLKGSAVHEFSEGGRMELCENCVYFFNARDAYSVSVIEPTEAYSLHFSTYGEVETDSFCIRVANIEPFLSLLEKTDVMKNSGASLSLLSVAYRLCAEIDKVKNKAYFPKNLKAEAGKKFIDENFKKSSCLSEAVAHSGVSGRRFGELFRKSFYLTPNKYIVQKRIEYAKSLLSTGLFTVTETAEQCGFSDVYYFARVFRNETGITPGKWKK